METSTTIVTKGAMLFAVLAAVPLWVMSGLTVDDLVRPFRGDKSAAPAPATEVNLGEATTEFPFDRLGGDKAPADNAAEGQTGSPQIEIAIPDGEIDERAADAPPRVETSGQGGDKQPPFWNDAPSDSPSPEFEGQKSPPEFEPPTPTQSRDNERAPRADDDIAGLMRRLDLLGAVHMNSARMSRGQAYRFRCEFPIPANANARRYFEATDTSERQAVQRVLAEAERWRRTQAQF